MRRSKKILGRQQILFVGFMTSFIPMLISGIVVGADLAQVEKRGSGSVDLVLIPCGGCDWRSWETFMERNRGNYVMHAVTLPGLDGGELPSFSGETQTPFLDYSAIAVADYVKSLKVGSVVLLGHSVGAIVALKTTISHPELVSAVILEDWGAVHPASLGLSAAERVKAAETASQANAQLSEDEYFSRYSEMMARAISDPARAQIYIDRLRAGHRNASRGTYEMRVLDIRPHLKELKLPMLGLFAIYPDTDADKRCKQAAELLAGAENLELIWFENTSHWIHEEKPDAFDSAVRSFIRSVASR